MNEDQLLPNECPVCGRITGGEVCSFCGHDPAPVLDVLQRRIDGAAIQVGMQAPARSRLCPSCGTSLKAYERFCPTCGGPITHAGCVATVLATFLLGLCALFFTGAGLFLLSLLEKSGPEILIAQFVAGAVMLFTVLVAIATIRFILPKEDGR